MTTVLSKPALELVKVLLDGEWHGARYLYLAAGPYIPPERASRQKSGGRLVSVEAGRRQIVRSILNGLSRRKRAEKRPLGNGTSEWKLTDRTWAEKQLHYAGAAPSAEPLTAETPAPAKTEPVTTIALEGGTQTTLAWAKASYEKEHGLNLSWETFVLLLLTFAQGGGLISASAPSARYSCTKAVSAHQRSIVGDFRTMVE